MLFLPWLMTPISRLLAYNDLPSALNGRKIDENADKHDD
jgi:hypothetical protein